MYLQITIVRTILARWCPSAEHDGKDEADRANCRIKAMKELADDEIVDSAEIKTKTKARIETILEQSKNGEI